ncbi:MAG: TonB-dependent receptor [Acidobacteria bacterium]|nr:TonB-dependent receptor [Acidobacteriota bacterium]
MQKIAVLFLSLLFCLGSWAQDYKGSVLLTVQDTNQQPLPGAVATLTSDTFNRTATSDAAGQARFIGLFPSSYDLTVSMAGFESVKQQGLVIETGANVKLTITLKVESTQEVLVVTAETPLMDARKFGTSTVITEDELTALPQARDPWAVMNTVPAIQTDRVNIGGSESGQQSNLVAHGDNGDNTTWVIDGLEFADRSAEGATSSYLDFGMFSQVSFGTGGSSAEVGGAGVRLNFVTKQGSNQHTGHLRLLWADKSFQSHNIPDDLAAQGYVGNRINETFEKGFELGGPVVKDRLWYYAAFNQNDIDTLVITGASDKTKLRNLTLKFHGDITSSTRFNVLYTEGDKIKNGRGAATTRPQETTWDQDGPTPIYKLEINQMVGTNTELTLLAGHVGGGFQLTPKGDANQQITYNYDDGVWGRTYYHYQVERPQDQVTLRGNSFFTTGRLTHDFEFGAFSQKFEDKTNLDYGTENQVIAAFSGGQGVEAWLYRNQVSASEFDTKGLFLNDVMEFGDFTFNAGLRYEVQGGNNSATSSPANSIRPDLLPELNYSGSNQEFEWKNISPRLGLTYTFGDHRQFLARANYAIYYDPIAATEISFNNPTDQSEVDLPWTDLNGDGLVQGNEVDDTTILYTYNYDPANPTAANSVKRVDPDLKAPKVSEMILGGEWSITPEFVLGATYTYRERTDEEWSPNYYLDANGNVQIFTSADYEAAGTVSGTNAYDNSTYEETYYQLTDAALAAWNAAGRGTYLTNRDGYSEEYSGIELTATKRLSNKWMMRASLSTNDWTKHLKPNAIQDPTNQQGGSTEDGGEMAVQSAGSGSRGNIWVGSASWQANLNGLYQLPFGMAISANLFGREGFSAPLYDLSPSIRGEGRKNVAVGRVGDYKFDDLWNLDLKFTKTITKERTTVDLALEAFNVLNSDTSLALQTRLDTANAGQSVEILSPRILRLSATIHF